MAAQINIYGTMHNVAGDPPIDGVKTINNESIFGDTNIELQTPLTEGTGISIEGGTISVDVDDELSASSNNPVKNSVIHAALGGKQNTLTEANAGTNVTIEEVGGVVKISATGGGGGGSADPTIDATKTTSFTADVDKYYRFDSAVSGMVVTLPVPTGTTTKTITFFGTMGAANGITFTSASTPLYSASYELESGKTYEISALWNGRRWVIANVEITVPASIPQTLTDSNGDTLVDSNGDTLVATAE